MRRSPAKLHPSDKLIRFLTRWESFTAYATHYGFDPAGIYTIGYGHTLGVQPDDGPITERAARRMLRGDVHLYAAAAVRLAVKVPLHQREFDALVSFVYNLGPGVLAGTDLLELLNKGAYNLVPDQIMRYVHADGVVLEGLVNRRKAEVRVWRRGRYAVR